MQFEKRIDTFIKHNVMGNIDAACRDIKALKTFFVECYSQGKCTVWTYTQVSGDCRDEG
jgi:hypothetical protein